MCKLKKILSTMWVTVTAPVFVVTLLKLIISDSFNKNNYSLLKSFLHNCFSI